MVALDLFCENQFAKLPVAANHQAYSFYKVKESLYRIFSPVEIDRGNTLAEIENAATCV